MGIKSAVGAKKKNGRAAENLLSDVKNVRDWLNYHIQHNPSFLSQKPMFTKLPLVTVGDMSETIRAIKTFEMYTLKIQQPTGCIEPGDATMLQLETGNVPGMISPEVLAPIKDRVHYKLSLAYEYDYIATFDSTGELKSFLKMLLENPDIDDTYLRHEYFEGNTRNSDDRMEKYIVKAHESMPPPPIDFSVSVIGEIIRKIKELSTTDQFVRFVANIVDQIYSGYREYTKLDGQHTTSVAPSPNGPYAASKNIGNWYQERFYNPKSIYVCFPDIPKQVNAVDPFDAEWWGL